MSHGPKRGVLSLGLVGVGPVWERRYKGPVRRLAERCAIRAVFDPVLSRAEAVAQDCGAEVVAGMRQLFERTDVQAVLLLDAAWYGSCPLEWCIDAQKPVFLAEAWSLDHHEAERLDRLATGRGVQLVPEFPLRFLPTSSRLRELLATKLGAVRTVTISALSVEHNPAAPAHALSVAAAWLDWCLCVSRCDPRTLNLLDEQAERECGRWQFSLDSAGYARLSGAATSLPNIDAASTSLSIELECEHGRACLNGAETLTWEMPGTGACVETLGTERTAFDVMFDQFCRRAVGGLVPVPTLTDLYHAKRLMESVSASFRDLT